MFKADDARFLELTDREGFVPAPYLARAKWVKVDGVSDCPTPRLKQLLTRRIRGDGLAKKVEAGDRPRSTSRRRRASSMTRASAPDPAGRISTRARAAIRPRARPT